MRKCDHANNLHSIMNHMGTKLSNDSPKQNCQYNHISFNLIGNQNTVISLVKYIDPFVRRMERRYISTPIFERPSWYRSKSLIIESSYREGGLSISRVRDIPICEKKREEVYIYPLRFWSGQ